MQVRRASLWALGLGALSALGQAPVSLPFATLLGLGALFWLFQDARTPRAAAWLGWFFGLGYFMLALNWIVEPFFVDPWRHGWMAPFAIVLLSGGLALFWGAALWIAKRIASGPLATAIAFATTLTAAELARSFVLTGFPWALIGHVWIGWAPMQLASWIGQHGLTMFTVLNAALAVSWWKKWWHLANLMAATCTLVLAANFVVFSWFGPAQSHLIRLVQPNAPQHLKWHPDHARGFFDRAVELTAAEAETKPDLIIWPETSVPALLEHADIALERIAEASGDTPVILGIQRRDGRAFHNSLAILKQGVITDIYDKHHLVPFGEYIPGFAVLTRLPFGSFVEEHGFGYTPGPGPRLLDLGPLGKALPLICYEAIFPQYSHAEERPNFLLQITNDAWFGQWIGPYQHLAQARLRAVEQGLPMVRVANTGVSAVIDPWGKVLAQLPLNAAGFLDVALPPPSRATLYAQTGDWPATLFILGVFVALITARRRKQD